MPQQAARRQRHRAPGHAGASGSVGVGSAMGGESRDDPVKSRPIQSSFSGSEIRVAVDCPPPPEQRRPRDGRRAPHPRPVWPALDELLDHGGPAARCWCMAWRLGPEYRRRGADENRADLQRIVSAGPPPGLLAFHDDLAVGWCQVTPRDAVPAIERQWRLRRRRRRARLGDHLLLRPQGPPPCGDHGGPDRRGRGPRPGGRRARGRGVPARRQRLPQRDEHRLRDDVRRCGVRRGGPPLAGAPDHAATRWSSRRS